MEVPTALLISHIFFMFSYETLLLSFIIQTLAYGASSWIYMRIHHPGYGANEECVCPQPHIELQIAPASLG